MVNIILVGGWYPCGFSVSVQEGTMFEITYGCIQS